MRVTLQCPLPSLYVFACKNGRVVAELWSSCAEYRASCAEYRASCGRVARVLGELLGEIVKFRQLAQKRLGGHLCLGGGGGRERKTKRHFHFREGFVVFFYFEAALTPPDFFYPRVTTSVRRRVSGPIQSYTRLYAG